MTASQARALKVGDRVIHTPSGARGMVSRFPFGRMSIAWDDNPKQPITYWLLDGLEIKHIQ